MAEHSEARIVDDIFDLDVSSSERRGNPVATVGLLQIARNDNRRRAACGNDLAGQRFEAIGAPRRQCNPVTFQRKQARQFDAYSRRGTGNQRHTISHGSMLLKLFATMWCLAFAPDHRLEVGCKASASIPPS